MTQHNQTEVTISNRTVVRLILLTIITIAGIKFTLSVSGMLVLIFISFFLALALNPAVGWIARKLKLKRRATATAIAYLAVVVIVGTLITYIVPPLVRQTYDFLVDLPTTLSSLQTSDSLAGRFVRNYDLTEQLNGFKENIEVYTTKLREPVVATAGKLGSALVSIITVLVLTFMMLVEGPSWLNRLWRMMPKHRREHNQMIANKMYGVVTGFVNGQLILSLIAASFAFMVLLISSTLLDVSVNAVALAGILIFTGLIPMIGSTIGGVLVTIACLFVSAPLALIMAIFFIVYQQIENISLQPYIQAKYNELSPLLVFVAALLGIGFGGFLGALIAIPAAGCAKILLLDYLERRSSRS